MATQYEPAFRIARKYPEQFGAALQLLLGDHLADSLERRRAMRRLIDILFRCQNDFDEDQPPRAAYTKRLLADVEQTSRALRQKILPLSELLSLYSDLVFPSRLFDSRLWDSIRDSNVYGADSDPDLNQSELYRELLALEEACRNLIRYLPDDRGGRANLMTGRLGNPKARLALDAGLLFIELRPGDISSNPKEPFYEFFGALFEMLTGQEPEATGAGLNRYTDHAVPRLRRLEATRAPRMRLILKAMRIGLNEEEKKQLADIERKVSALQEELEIGPSSGRNPP